MFVSMISLKKEIIIKKKIIDFNKQFFFNLILPNGASIMLSKDFKSQTKLSTHLVHMCYSCK